MFSRRSCTARIAVLGVLWPQFTGENVVRNATKINPNRITNSGHHRSIQDTDSLDKLIKLLLFPLPILTGNESCVQLADSRQIAFLRIFNGWQRCSCGAYLPPEHTRRKIRWLDISLVPGR